MRREDNEQLTLHSMDMAPWRELLESELPKGVEAVEIYAAEGEKFSVGLLDGEIDSYQLSQSNSVALRADCGQIGYAYSEAADQDPRALLQDAVESAGSVQSEDAPFQRFYEGGDAYVQLPAVDVRLTQSTAEEKIALAYELERMALDADPRVVRLENCVVSTGISRTAIANSLGLSAKTQSGYAIAYCRPIVEAAGEVKNGAGYDIARSLEELDLYKVVQEAAQDALDQLGAGTVPSGEYAVVFKNTATISLLGVFASIFSADAAQKGMSLLAGKEGESIASAGVRLVDDPLHPLSLFPVAFDAEGVAAQRTEIIVDGRLRTLLHNRKTAQKAGGQTTANAVRGGGSIGVGPTNLLLEAGESDLQDLLRQMGEGLFITDVSGLHAGANPVSGSFSLLARGFVVEGGEKMRPVDQITVSGNVFELLKRISAVGNDLRFGMGNIAAPAVWVERLQVAGS